MKRIKTAGFGTAEGAALLALIHWVNSWWAWPLAALIWFIHTRGTSDLVRRSVWGIALASLIIVLAINANVIGQILIVASYVLWQLGVAYYEATPGFRVAQAGWLEFMALTAVFSAEAIWHWPVALVLVAVYAASIVVALAFFSRGERAVRALAAAWGLIVTEASFVFSVWLVGYVLPHNILLVPQAAVVITAVGYCFGSIYLAHSSSKLSKARLAEYAIIGLCLVIIVIAGTHWNGSI